MAYSSQQNDYVNPADLFADNFTSFDPTIKVEFDYSDTTLGAASVNGWANPADLTHSHQDSAIDLRDLYTSGPEEYTRIKAEDFPEFGDMIRTPPYSTPVSNNSNTPSQHGDMIFSNVNSPGDYTRDQSQTSSPEGNNDAYTRDSIVIPQSIDPLAVSVFVDKMKTRAETQIKTVLILDPLPRQYQYIRFPRHTLSKSKQLASSDEIEANESGDSAVRVDLTLVCATAVEKQEGMDRALRRARGLETMPRRPRGTQVSEIDKDDSAHPQNGGAVVICEGCKERERKRYDRKKKRNQEEENEWSSYEDDRIIMINEKEFKRWQDVEGDQQHGPDARRVEFAMRITCYCRHQEEKTPVGYRVIFTFRDTTDTVLAQKISDIIQITDDHKNRELPLVGSISTDLSIHPPPREESMSTQYSMPMYNYPNQQSVYGMYSQPTTPVMAQFQSPLSPMDGHYTQNTGVNPQFPHQSAFAFGGGAVAATQPVPSYASHQRFQSYSNTPMLSPTEQFAAAQAGYPLHRPHSMDSFSAAFASMNPSQSTAYPQNFASQPPSRNVSRPASPSWEQGASRTKKMRAVPNFFMEDPEKE
jgi:hypothetical protein